MHQPYLVKRAVLTIERYWLGYKSRKEFRNKQSIKKAMIEEYLAKKRKKENSLRKAPIAEIIPLPQKRTLDLAFSPRIPRNTFMKEIISSHSHKKKLFSEVSSYRLEGEMSMKAVLPPPESALQKKIMIAARTNNFGMLEVGTEKIYPSDVNTVDILANTPLHYAAKLGNKNLCQFLVEKGAYLDQIGQDGNQPLHLAYLSGSVPVNLAYKTVLFLLSRNAPSLVRNNYGDLPENLAAPSVRKAVDQATHQAKAVSLTSVTTRANETSNLTLGLGTRRGKEELSSNLH
jgi:ankyrin repeat protein